MDLKEEGERERVGGRERKSKLVRGRETEREGQLVCG